MRNQGVKSLWAGALTAKPVSFDFSAGYGETWEPHEATRCEKCDGILVGLGLGGQTHSRADAETECDGHVSETSGPMMNYFYPLPHDPDDLDAAARAIVDLPLCLVEMLPGDGPLAGDWGLALTGGGMDLSWEICEAYMRLGYLPPLHFADLPGIAGRGASKRDRWIIAGVKQSAQATISRACMLLKHTRERFPAAPKAKPVKP